MKIFYLFLYNCTMSLAWITFFGYLLSNVSLPGSWENGLYIEPSAIEEGVKICCVLQLVACLELLHVLLGLVKGSLFATIVQLLGRNHILLAGVYCLPELWTAQCVGWLFIFWAAIEIIRYPTYALSLYSLPGSSLFTWLRYTAFIPLYPIGFSTELWIYSIMLTILKQQEADEQTSGIPPLHTLRMPNAFNFAFDYRIFLYIFSCVAIWGFCKNYVYMFAQRKKKYATSKQKPL